MTMDYSIYLVAQTNACPPGKLLITVEEAVKGGVTLVQLREKEAAPGDFAVLAQDLKRLLDIYQVPLIINDNLDVALACDAAGVHLGQSDTPLAQARQILGPNKIIGISAANAAQAVAAEKGGADYIGASAVYATATKTNAPALGLEGLRAITRAVKIPVVAVGGIKAGNAALMRQNGAAGIAVVSAIMAAPNPRRAAAELARAFCGE